MSKARSLAALGNAYDDGALSNRNLIINGAMQVAQRGTSFSGLTASQYTLDRWLSDENGTVVFTVTKEADGPDGFANSLKINVDTANASLAAGDYFFLAHKFEGQNLQSLKKGTSAALPVTLSFWVKSNVTGTYILEFDDNDNSRNINKSYTVYSSGTWEYKTITFEGDTVAGFDDDASFSARLFWWLDAGSNFRGGTLATSWGSTNNVDRVEGNVTFADTVNNYWQITGVQLEVGDTATPFEHRSYGQELALCQRYYQRSVQTVGTTFGYGDGDVAAANCVNTNWLMDNLGFKVTMRAIPTFRNSGGAGTTGTVMRSSTGGNISLTLNCRTDGEVRGFPGGNVNAYESVQFSWDADAEL